MYVWMGPGTLAAFFWPMCKKERAHRRMTCVFFQKNFFHKKIFCSQGGPGCESAPLHALKIFFSGSKFFHRVVPPGANPAVSPPEKKKIEKNFDFGIFFRNFFWWSRVRIRPAVSPPKIFFRKKNFDFKFFFRNFFRR